MAQTNSLLTRREQRKSVIITTGELILCTVHVLLLPLFEKLGQMPCM